MIDEQPTITGTVIGSCEYPYLNGFKEGKQVGYNKAIDEFAEKAKRQLEDMGCEAWNKDIDTIAEQMKAGGSNE